MVRKTKTATVVDKVAGMILVHQTLDGQKFI